MPTRPVEAAIALSIVFLAAEILHARQGRIGLTHQFPWLIAFAFGLLHGLGFASALGQVGLPAAEIPLALLFFNLGVEIGQLLFVAVCPELRLDVPRGSRWPGRARLEPVARLSDRHARRVLVHRADGRDRARLLGASGRPAGRGFGLAFAAGCAYIGATFRAG